MRTTQSSKIRDYFKTPFSKTDNENSGKNQNIRDLNSSMGSTGTTAVQLTRNLSVEEKNIIQIHKRLLP